jgi:hypothetical protein
MTFFSISPKDQKEKQKRMTCPKTPKNLKINIGNKRLTPTLPTKKCLSPLALFPLFLQKRENRAKIALRGIDY